MSFQILDLFTENYYFKKKKACDFVMFAHGKLENLLQV